MRGEERAARMIRLLEYLNQQERPVPVAELVSLAHREFGVSEVTLRSDLAALCSLRGVSRAARGTYGVAASPGGEAAGPGAPGALFATRLLRRAEEKLAIAAAVVALLRAATDLRVLLLDAGTTTCYVADRLSEECGLDLIVWTPSVAAAARLAGSRGISVRLLGGEFHPEYAVVSGDETARALRTLAGPEAAAAPLADPLPSFPGTHTVLDVNYVAEDGRLYTDESKERLQKRLMADLAEELTLAVDHTKLFQRRLGLQAHEVDAPARLAGKRALRLVTDSGADELQRRGVLALLATLLPGTVPRVEERDGALIFSALRE